MLTSGNATVDRIGAMNLSGNVIPDQWFSTILKDNGKPYLNAIVLLAEIVYWHRPKEIRDQKTGQLISIRKRFDADCLQLSYRKIIDKFGFSKAECRAALDYLEQKGLVHREFRTASFGERDFNNVMYLHLNVDALISVTYSLESPFLFQSVTGLSSGHETVDKMWQINFTGSVIPEMWYKHLRKENQKPYLNAILVLNQLVYWYRPTEVRDPATGRLIGWKKKFKADLLQKNYEELGENYAINARDVQRAVSFLESQGLVQRVIRNIKVNDLVFTNVLYLQLNPDQLAKITYKKDPEESGQAPQSVDNAKVDRICTRVRTEFALGSGQNLNEVPDRNLTRTPTEFEQGSGQILNEIPDKNLTSTRTEFEQGSGQNLEETPQKTVRTYTKNTTENTTKTTTEITTDTVCVSIPPSTSKPKPNAVILDFNHHLTQAEEDEMDGLMKQNDGIPYALKDDLPGMTKMIQFVMYWNTLPKMYEQFYGKGDLLQMPLDLVKLAIESLIEMATAEQLEKYGRSYATYANVIDQLNILYRRRHYMSDFCDFIFSCCQIYWQNDLEKTKSIRNPKKYMKAVIWSRFSTYQTDSSSEFCHSFINPLRGKQDEDTKTVTEEERELLRIRRAEDQEQEEDEYMDLISIPKQTGTP